MMKKWQVIIVTVLFCLFLFINSSYAQCSICTKTASQLGEKPAMGLNSGIVYLMLTPFAVAGFIGYRWWSREKALQHESPDA